MPFFCQRGLLWHAFCVWILRWQCTCCCWRIPKVFSRSKDSISKCIYANSPDIAWYWFLFRVLLCSLKGRWYEWLTHERTFLRWFREVHVCPLVVWPLALAYHICRCGELYMRKIWILTMIKGYNIGTRRPCSAYGFVPMDKSSSRTVKHHFIQWWGVFYPGRCK